MKSRPLAEAKAVLSQKKGSSLGARVLTLVIVSCCITLFSSILLSSLGDRSTLSLIIHACHPLSSPQACQSSLTLSPPAISPAHVVAIAVSFARESLQVCHSRSQALLPTKSQNPKLAGVVRSCEYLLRRALHVIEKCTLYMMEDNDTIASFLNAENSRSAHMIGRHVNLNKSVSGFTKIKDMEAWMSAALTWENDCYSALGYVNGTTMPHHGGHAKDDATSFSRKGLYTSLQIRDTGMWTTSDWFLQWQFLKMELEVI